MDKSEEYIKMCESAKEIQKVWQPNVGDWFLNDYRRTTGFSEDVEKQIWGNDKDKWEKIQCLTYKPSIKEYVTISDSDGSHVHRMDEFFKHRHVFLPSQDYLQKLIQGNFIKVLDKESDFADSSYPIHPYTTLSHFKSREQLLLGLVMKEKYDKVWNGSEWIKNELQ